MQSAPLNAERDDLAQRLKAAPTTPVIELHPQAVAEYERFATDLAVRLATLDLTEDRETIDKFRTLIDRVVIHAAPDGGVEAEVVGRMSAVLGLPAGDVGGMMVSEEGCATNCAETPGNLDSRRSGSSPDTCHCHKTTNLATRWADGFMSSGDVFLAVRAYA